jgi:hypothetical protein
VIDRRGHFARLLMSRTGHCRSAASRVSLNRTIPADDQGTATGAILKRWVGARHTSAISVASAKTTSGWKQ